MSKSLASQPVEQVYIPLTGGLDLLTPPLEAAPGALIDSSNFDVNTLGGYRRIDGYEKFDGQLLCNSYGYYTIYATLVAPINVGRTIVGDTSGATGLVIGVSDSLVYFALPTGTFIAGEFIRVLGENVGTVAEAPYQRLDRSTAESAALMADSATAHRASIQSIPGSGRVLGLCVLAGVLYGFRNSADASTMRVFKATLAGWVECSLGLSVAFSGGSGVLDEGLVLTQGGVTATVLRVVVRSGSLGAGTAQGSLIIDAPAGGSFTAGAATVSGGTLNLLGAQAPITHAPNGRIRTAVANFGTAIRMYWCSGVDYAYEFDGSIAVPIVSGMSVDKPAFIAVHKNHLFLTFENSLQHSGIGAPYAWTTVLGAAELNMGEVITNLLPQPSDAQSGGAMVISTRNSLSVLYGTSSADWKLVILQRDAGAVAHTIQSIAGNTYYLDDRGISNLVQAQEFGNFLSATLSARLSPWLIARKGNVIDSCVIKEKNQFRLLFQGGTAMHITFDGAKLTGMMPVQYAHNIVCSHSAELSDGTEAVYYGDDDGNVYLADNGPSFAGISVTAFFKTHFNHCKSPRQKKRFRKLIFEVGGSGFADFQLGAELGYGTYDVATQPLLIVDVSFAGPRWDDPSVFWDGGVWDGRVLLPVEVPLFGSEENISFTVYQTSDKYMGLNFQGALLRFSRRRAKR